MTEQEAVRAIRNSGGKIFRCFFEKRTNGELRDMVARIGVKSHLKGGELAFNPAEKGLVVVFDMVKANYRMLNVRGLEWLKLRGRWYQVTRRKSKSDV